MSYKKIMSKDNLTYKKIKSLNTKKYRKKENMFIVEGWKTILHAIKYNIYPRYILRDADSIDYFETQKSKFEFVDDELNITIDSCRDFDTMFIELPSELFTDISDVENSQGILAVFDMQNVVFDISNIEKTEKKDILIVDRVQDPGNLGTIIRACDAFGVSSIFMLKGTVDIFSSKVLRSTMGSIFDVNICSDLEEEELLSYIKLSDKKLLVSSLEAESEFISSLKSKFYMDKIALVIGNESNGVSQFWLENACEKVKINMTGAAESLNVAMATSIMLHAIQENRN